MDRVVLNVGGQIFHTTKATLCAADPNSMLAKMFDDNLALASSVKDESGAWFIDRDPLYFRVILNFLRNPAKLIMDENLNAEGVLEEATFFQVAPLIALLQSPNRADITRRHVIKHKKTISFRGVRMPGIDLSYMQLSGESFDASVVANANFEACNLDNAQFISSEGPGVCFNRIHADETKFVDCNFPNSSFNQSIISHGNFNEARLTNASFVSADCTGCLFQKTKLDGANFAGATLEHAKFHNASLRDANLTNTNLSHTHFTYADLRGAKINWQPQFKIQAAKAKVTRQDYAAIPLSEEEKTQLKLIVVEDEK